MNIIEAWKQAKEGQKIERKNSKSVFIFYKNSDMPLQKHLGHVYDYDFLADDWEVMKEKKTKMTSMKDFSKNGRINHARSGVDYEGNFYPDDAKVTIEWEE